MPSTQQRFEGPDLEVLLAEVRGAYGDDVAILEANKIRKGGVGGFFARELFEIVIDADGADARPRAAAGATLSATGSIDEAATSILDLVDRVDDGPAPRVEPADLARRETIDALMAKTADAPVLRPDDATLSTEGDAFADLLGRIAMSSQEPAAADVDPPLHENADDEPFQPFARTAPAATATTPRPSPQATRTTEDTDPMQTLQEPTIAARGQRLARATTTTMQTRRPLIEQLGLDRLGIPASYLDMAVPDGDRIRALMTLADRFPQAMALPRSAASVVVLIGDRRGIQPAVEHVCTELQLDPGSLLLASRNRTSTFPEDRRIAGSDEASARRLSFRRRPAPSLVVIDEPVGRLRSAWARQVVDALEPTAVWGVVEAKAKTEDVVDWCEQLGGVDALALHGLDETNTPATVLSTGLPISLIDGKPATSARWAAVLDERLLAA